MAELKTESPERTPDFLGLADPEPTPATETPDAPAGIDYTAIATQIAHTLRQVVSSGEELAGIVINPENHAAFTAAFQALPDELVPAEIKARMPIEADPNCEGLQIITRSQIEAQFLQRFFGPEEQGGDGTLPRLQRALETANSPVKITVDFLRHLYLSRRLEEIQPRIVRPQDASLLVNPLRR